MPLNRGVFDHDFDLIKIHHREAWQEMGSRAELYKWKQSTTQTDDENLYDDVQTVGFETPVSILIVFDHDVTAEKMKKYGITEKPDAVIHTSIILLQDMNLVVTNRDRIKFEGLLYDVTSNDDPRNMGNRRLDYVLPVRLVQ
jgi:hypothetical protein